MHLDNSNTSSDLKYCVNVQLSQYENSTEISPVGYLSETACRLSSSIVEKTAKELTHIFIQAGLHNCACVFCKPDEVIIMTNPYVQMYGWAEIKLPSTSVHQMNLRLVLRQFVEPNRTFVHMICHELYACIFTKHTWHSYANLPLYKNKFFCCFLNNGAIATCSVTEIANWTYLCAILYCDSCTLTQYFKMGVVRLLILCILLQGVEHTFSVVAGVSGRHLRQTHNRDTRE